VRNISNKICR